MTYRAVLPQVFPHAFVMPADMAADMAAMLMQTDRDYPNGSSFAVTADVERADERKLYLSEASLTRLRAQGHRL